MSDVQSKLGEGLSKFQEGIDQRKQKLKTSQDVSKLKKQVQETSLKKSKLLINLGQTTYQLIREGKINDPQLVELSQSMVGFDNVIYQSYKKIAELTEGEQRAYSCECGAPVQPTDKFCESCGKKVTIAEPKELETIQCPACEEEIAKDANFCGSCGKKLAS